MYADLYSVTVPCNLDQKPQPADSFKKYKIKQILKNRVMS